MNRHVNLTKRVRTPNGLRFCSVVVSANGRVKPHCVLVGDHEEHHPEGAYYLEWYNGARRMRRSVGKDAAAAAAQRHQREQILASKAAGVRLAEDANTGGTLLGDAVAIYLDEIKKTKKHKTWSAYKAALSYFLAGPYELRFRPLSVLLSKFRPWIQSPGPAPSWPENLAGIQISPKFTCSSWSLTESCSVVELEPQGLTSKPSF